ncbi:MAG: hypothetical protein U9O95_01390 [Candidatus Marinimicrobia bacterium]|nr:hypothetical protein [Candidatus Neomarinimicrobiota bacterium]
MKIRNRHACSDLAKIQNMKSRRYQILPLAIGSFKSAVSRSIHLAGYWEFKWQKSYYDRIIRMKELNRIRTYIRNNPLQKHEKE